MDKIIKFSVSIIPIFIFSLSIGNNISYTQEQTPKPKIEHEQKGESEYIIKLRSFNWERVGETRLIDKDGNYIVNLTRASFIEKTEKGKLEPFELEELKKLIESDELDSLKNKYDEPRKTTRSRINYLLTIKTGRGEKTIEFHSEVEMLPEYLLKIVKKIEEFTK